MSDALRVFHTANGGQHVVTGPSITVAGTAAWPVRMGDDDALLVELPSSLRWNELRSREQEMRMEPHALTAREIGMLAPVEGGVMPYRGSSQAAAAYAVWPARPTRALSHALTRGRAGDALSPHLVLNLVLECARGLAVTEGRGLLTPSSVLIDGAGKAQLRGALLEALVAQAANDETAPRWLGYRAPELLRPAATPTAAARSFALGVMIFELLTGRPLFPASGPAAAAQLARWNVTLAITAELGPEVNAELRAILWSLLHREPDRRVRASLIIERLAPHYDPDPQSAAWLAPDPSLAQMFAR